MLNKLPLITLLACLLVGSGCDSETVHENIDTFTCSWLPWWMADCSSTEVHNKAISILDNGMIQGTVLCSGSFLYKTIQTNCSGDCLFDQTGTFSYKAQKIQDGSCFVNWSVIDQYDTIVVNKDVGFIPRNMPEASTCKVYFSPDVNLTLDSGELIIHSATTSASHGNIFGPTADTVFELSGSSCTGNNLSAFGVP